MDYIMMLYITIYYIYITYVRYNTYKTYIPNNNKNVSPRVVVVRGVCII